MRSLLPLALVVLLTSCGPSAPSPGARPASDAPAGAAPDQGSHGGAEAPGPAPGDDRCDDLLVPVTEEPAPEPPSTDCAHVARPLPPMRVQQTFVDAGHDACRVQGADAAGNIAVLLSTRYDDPVPSFTWELISPDGTPRQVTLPPAYLWPARRGFVANASNATLQRIDEAGAPACAPVPVDDETLVFVGPHRELVVLPAFPEQPLMMPFGPYAGVDDGGRVLSMRGSTIYGEPAIVGRWFDRDGTALTEPFVVASGVGVGDTSWLETAPVYGGLAVAWGSDGARLIGFERRWIAIVPSGSTCAEPAPDWLRSRPNTELLRTRGGYALLDQPRIDQIACSDRLELLTAAGESCGVLELPIDSTPCIQTGGLTVGLDGTLIQQLPYSREPYDPSDPTREACTVRWWPAALP
jgi:hypothetical protein